MEKNTAIYDKIYKEKDYFGLPSNEVLQYFHRQNKGRVADLGAGQGRNSIPLFDMGFDVTAVDLSAVGLAQAKSRQPRLRTVREDCKKFDTSPFDIVLLDSMLHFSPSSKEWDSSLLQKIGEEMKEGGKLVIALRKRKNLKKHLIAFLSHWFFVEHVQENIRKNFCCKYLLICAVKKPLTQTQKEFRQKPAPQTKPKQ